ncbi:MAG: HutD/Ves family protein, partial [Dongiaceae bacterium]
TGPLAPRQQEFAHGSLEQLEWGKHMTRFGRDSVAGSSLAIRVIDASHHRVMPWKNGFGTTTEIAIDPPDAAVGGRFRWRLSIADVERSGPFSAFPGYERTIMVIAGRGMDLAVGDRPMRRLDRPFEAFVFSGDSSAECRLLEGPIRDFNLMVERSSLRSRLEVLYLDAASRLFDVPFGDMIIHCFDGAIDFAMRAGAPAGTLRTNCTAILSRASSTHDGLQLAAAAGGRATAAIIELRPA